MKLFPLLKRNNAPGTGGPSFFPLRECRPGLGRRLRFETLEDRRLLTVGTTPADYSENSFFADSICLESATPKITAAVHSSLVLSVADLEPVLPGATCTLTVKYHVENAENTTLNDFSLRIYFDSTYIQTVKKSDTYASQHGFTEVQSPFNQLPDISVSCANSPKQPISSVLYSDTTGDFETDTNYYVECSWVLLENNCLPLTTFDRTLVSLTFTVQDAATVTNAAAMTFYFTGIITTPTASWSKPDTASTTVSVIGKLPTIDPPTLTKTDRCDEVTVSWKSVDGAAGYKLEYWPSGDSAHPTTVVDSFTGTTWLVTDLSPNTLYYFKVTAKSPYGSDYHSTSQNSMTTDPAIYDLCVKAAGTLSTQSVGSGDTLTISNFGVKNLGNYASGDFTVSFYASTDSQITAADTLLGTLDATSVAFGESVTLSSDPLSTESLAPGKTYYIGWIINKTNDSDLTNNTARLEKTLYKKLTLTGVSITGTVQFNQTLTAKITADGTLSNKTVTYQWYRGETAIALATGSTYQITTSDVGFTLKVTATGSDDYNTTTVTSTPTADVPKIPLDPPTLTFGTITPNSIAVTVGTVTNAAGYLTQYALNKDFDNAKTLTDSTLTGLLPNTTYYFRTKALGDTIYADSDWSDTQNAKTEKITLTGVTITGTAQFNQTLTAKITADGTLSNKTVTYQWYRGETVIDGATGSTYQITTSDVGFTLKVTATGSDDYNATTVTSAPTTAVPKIPLDPPTLTFGTITPNSIAVTVGTVTNAAGYLTQYALNKDFDNAKTLTDSTLTGLLPNTTYYFRTKALGDTVYETSDWSDTQNAKTEKITLTGVTISGTAQVGQTLIAVLEPDGAIATYQWYRDNMAIDGANESFYKLQIADADHTIHVVATGTDHSTGEAASAPTAAVTRTPYCFAQDVYTASPYGDIYITVREPDSELTYLFDLDGDGDYEKSVERGFETLGFYVSVSDRLAADAYNIRVRTIDSQGYSSPSADAQVRVIFSPTLTVLRSLRQDGQILLLNLGITGSRTIASWSINWGDSSPQVYDQISNRLSAIHYYGAVQEATDVTVTVTDICGETYSFVAARHSVTISPSQNAPKFSLPQSAEPGIAPVEDAAVWARFNPQTIQESVVRWNVSGRANECAPSEGAGEISANVLDTIFDDLPAAAFWEQETFGADSITAADWLEPFWSDSKNDSPSEPLETAFDLWLE